MSASDSPFVIAQKLALPGLGVLVLPMAPVPEWLASPDLHTAVTLRLSTSQQSMSFSATIEELSYPAQLPTRALLLDATLEDELAPGTWLMLAVVHGENLF
jgi:hypothetical protein